LLVESLESSVELLCVAEVVWPFAEELDESVEDWSV
jgi:hypothetical protein